MLHRGLAELEMGVFFFSLMSDVEAANDSF
jgi:hypothetical protein